MSMRSRSTACGHGKEQTCPANDVAEDPVPEADELVCRICRTGPAEEGDEAKRKLFHPCKCSGSIKYVHEDCLVQWLKHSKRKKCEVCGFEYGFTPIYKEDAPGVLSLSEFFGGLMKRAWRASRSCLRFAMVGFVWLVVVPLITSWVWRLCFARQTQQTILSIARRSCVFNLLITDCVYGSFLSAAIVFVFLGTASLREYLRQIRFAHNGANNNNNNNNGMVVGAVGHLGDNFLEEEERRGAAWVADGQEGAMAADAQNRPPPQPNAGGLDLDRIEDVPFEELIGMQGPLLSLLENASTILLSNLFFLVASVMLPFNMGRLCLSVLRHFEFNSFKEAFMDDDGDGLKTKVIAASLEAMGSIKEGISTELGVAASMAASTSNKLVRAATDFEAQLEPPTWKDLLTLGTGYLATLALGATIGFAVIFLRCLRAYTSSGDPLHQSLSARELLLMARSAYSYLSYSCVVLKVAFLLVVELGVFPLFFGLWLDLCSLPLFDAGLHTRMRFGLKAPITFTLVHWTLGIVYMFLVSVSVSVLREILKPGVLAFLRDPADPNINPFRELFEDPFTRHVRKIVLGSVIYGTIAMVLVYAPVQFVKGIFPESFPIVIKLLDPLSELPIHLLMIHFGLPLTFEYLRPKRLMRFVIHGWLRFASNALNVDTHILQRGVAAGSEGEDVGAGGGDQARQAGQAGAMAASGGASTSSGASTAGPRARRKISDVRTLVARSIGVYKESWLLFVRSEFTLNFRLALLVVASCLAVQLCNAVMLSLPLFLGRQLCRLTGFPVHHDVYNVLVGLYIIWGTSFLLSKWAAIVSQLPALVNGLVKYCVLGSLWLVVIPSVLGTLVHLTFVVPFTVPPSHTPIFFIYQDWAIGLVALKVLHWRNMERYRDLWRNVEDIWGNIASPSNIDFRWALVDVTMPPLVSLSAQLCVPYTLVHSVLPLAGVSVYFRQVVYRYGYMLLALLKQQSYVRETLWKLHNAIRDDRYLRGRALRNHGAGAAVVS